jgi:hypothetical protein
MSRFSLAFALIAAVSAGAQETSSPPAPPKLEIRPLAAGERAEIKIESTFELDIETKSTQEPDAPTKRQLSYARTLECSQIVQAGPEGASPTLRISVGTAKLQRSGTNIAPATESSEIENKTYLVTRTEKGRVVKAENGDPAPSDALALGAWEDFGALLPSGEAKEGATWTIDAAAISALVSIPDLVAPAGTFDAKIESLADGKAVVFFSGALKGKTTKGFDTTLEVTEGRLTLDTAKGRPTSLTVIGSLTATKDVFQKVVRQKELRQVDEKVGEVKVTSRKLEVKAEFK